MIQPDVNEVIDNLASQLAVACRDLAVANATLTATQARIDELETDE